MPEFEPTPEQSAILAHDPGQHARVLAGPGTGKSATLVALIDQLLSGTEAPRLRLLTFTHGATGELAKRVSAHLAAAAGRPNTINSFAISVLVRNPGAGDLPEPLRIADDWEYENVVRPILARRADVGVRTLDRLVREMSANWGIPPARARLGGRPDGADPLPWRLERATTISRSTRPKNRARGAEAEWQHNDASSAA